MVWRWVAAGLALALGVMAILLWRQDDARASDGVIPARPPAAGEAAIMAPMPEAPAASARTKEERRFNRYDKNRDDRITRDEYLASRRKAFAKLDTNGDGRLSFEEWAVKTTDKFAKADADRSGMLTRTEFATTAVKRKVPAQPNCPPAREREEEEPGA